MPPPLLPLPLALAPAVPPGAPPPPCRCRLCAAAAPCAATVGVSLRAVDGLVPAMASGSATAKSLPALRLKKRCMLPGGGAASLHCALQSRRSWGGTAASRFLHGQ